VPTTPLGTLRSAPAGPPSALRVRPTGFQSLGLASELVAAVTALGYEEPTPIQREAIPVLLAGHDLLGQAGTGTGKTAAFALPMLDRLAKDRGARGRGTRGLVLVPTRELAMQVAEAIHTYAKGIGLAVVPLYGGASMEQQVRALKRGADIVVATPGRVLDHIRRSTLRLDAVVVVVLDEGDEMLDMGFAEDIDAILAATPTTRQTALFSATMPARIAAIAQRHLKTPNRVTVAREKPAAGKVPRVRQTAYIVPRAQKSAVLGRVLEFESPKSAIVFCRTRLEVDALAETLDAYGYRAKALHGGMMQRERDRVMNAFREGGVDLLIATDVAARGLDIKHLSHVINYDVPAAPEDYLHRIGRTGRIGREGAAITLAEPREQRLLRNIESFTKQRIEILTVPSVTDLHARRLDVTRAALRERLAAGDFKDVRIVVETLAGEFDVLDIAAAAVKMAHDASGDGTPRKDKDIDVAPIRGRDEDSRGREHGDAGDRPRPGKAPRHQTRTHGGVLQRLYVGAGRAAGIGPGDLVGAITGEAGISAEDIGAIDISDRYSLVEVPESLVNDVITALRRTRLRGRKVEVRVYRTATDAQRS
jgi:ATP-dependent RNA helicase DeaD